MWSARVPRGLLDRTDAVPEEGDHDHGERRPAPTVGAPLDAGLPLIQAMGRRLSRVLAEGLAEYNAIYERARDHLAEVLQRPDQAITWTPWPGGR